MSSLCELRNAELDLVSGGATLKQPEPVRSSACNPVVTLIEDIIRVVESLEEGNRTGARKAA